MSDGNDFELGRIAELLGSSTAELGALYEIPAADLRVLRLQIMDSLAGSERERFARVAKLARLVPANIAAVITEAVVPPRLAAVIVDALDADRAAAIARAMSVRYLAAVALVLEPPRVQAIVALLEPETVVEISLSLVERQQWEVAGRFATVLEPRALTATVATLSGVELVRLAVHLDPPSRLPDIIAMVPDSCLDDLCVAVPTAGLWEYLDNLIDRIDPITAHRIAARFALAHSEVRGAYAEAARAGSRGAAQLLRTGDPGSVA
ncbi:hypothetical protein ACWIGW_16545 [Nocardia brasiliensis]